MISISILLLAWATRLQPVAQEWHVPEDRVVFIYLNYEELGLTTPKLTVKTMFTVAVSICCMLAVLMDSYSQLQLATLYEAMFCCQQDNATSQADVLGMDLKSC